MRGRDGVVVRRAPYAGDGGVVCIIDGLGGVQLDFDDLPAGVVNMGANDEAFPPATGVLNSDDVTGDDVLHDSARGCWSTRGRGAERELVREIGRGILGVKARKG